MPEFVRANATSKQNVKKMIDAVKAEDATSRGMTELGKRVDGQLVELASQVVSEDVPVNEKMSIDELEEREDESSLLPAQESARNTGFSFNNATADAAQIQST